MNVRSLELRPSAKQGAPQHTKTITKKEETP
nr:MAG TPA: hypothetical protein [Caudoviricetes sp.]